jgi:hypothetical protein
MRELLPRCDLAQGKMWAVSLDPAGRSVTWLSLNLRLAFRQLRYGKTRNKKSRISAISAAQTACAMG